MIEQPVEDVQVSAVWSDTGVDISDQVTLRFPGILASLRTSFAAGLHERMVIYGNEGKIVIPHPHFAEEVFLYDKNNELVMRFQDTVTENGFLYEIEEVANCIRDGRTESPGGSSQPYEGMCKAVRPDSGNQIKRSDLSPSYYFNT